MNGRGIREGGPGEPVWLRNQEYREAWADQPNVHLMGITQ